jgi:hypothetical protein
MDTLMILQMSLPTERLIAHITKIWPLRTMYAQMILQINLPTE